MLTARIDYRHPAQAILLIIIAALACAVSVVLTVRFCWDLRGEDGVFAGLVAVGIGLAWETSKYVYAPVGVRLALSGRPSLTAGGIGLCAISVVLVIGSIAASLGYLAELDTRQRDTKLRNSVDYQDAQARLAAFDEEIAILTRTARADTDHSYRKRALSTLATVRKLRAERAEVRASLSTMRAPSSGAAKASIFGGLASLLSVDAGRIRSIAYAIVSTMLELISLAAIVLLGMSRKPKIVVHADGGYAEPSEKPAQERNEAVMAAIDGPPRPPAPVVVFTPRDEPRIADDLSSADAVATVEPPDDVARYERAKRLVLEAQVAPTYRALQSALQLGQATARAFLEAMAAEGVLERIGNRYVLCGAS